MLTNPIARVAATATLTAIATLLPTTGGWADGGFNTVDCAQTPHSAHCDVQAGVPSRPGATGDQPDRGTSGDSAGVSRCHWRRVQPQAPAPPGAGPGAWHVRVCTRAAGGASESQPMWLDPQQQQNPALLGELAASRLNLPTPAIRINPAPPTAQIVFVPTWLWVGETTWSARSASATAGGSTVTATATPVAVRWRMGDGTVVTCHGQGTVWRPGGDPRRPSPTCGHTYRHTSPPVNGFLVRATVTWQITWSGGGQVGALPALTTTSQLVLRVVQAGAVNTTG
jgi:hypothetical protein